MKSVKEEKTYKCTIMNEITEDNNDFKYICEKCNLGTNSKYIYDKHLESVQHKGKRKTRNDKKEPYKCQHCDFFCNKMVTTKIHVLNNHATKTERKEGFKYYCDTCDVGTFSKQYFDMHLESKKHLRHVGE